MDDIFSKVTAILISSILLFLVPVSVMIEKNEQAMQTYIYTEIVDLTDRIRNTGCLTSEMYLDFLTALENTGNIYNIEIQHFYKEESNGEIANYTQQIRNRLSKDGVYRFKMGDIIKCKVSRKDGSLIGVYGGRIKDESY